MKINQNNIGKFIEKNPHQPVMMKHDSGKFTFHNVSMRSAVWFALKSTFKNFNKIRKERSRLREPIMHRIMSQYNPKHATPKGSEVSPNSTPPQGMRIGWSEARGYHYNKESEAMTNNQGIKQTNLMPKQKETK